MLIDLSRLPILPQQPTQHPLSPHPLNLGRHPGLSGTLPLTGTGVATLALRGKEIARASTRMDGGGLDNYAAVLDEFLDVRAGVGVPNLGLLIWVEPDFALANAGDRGGEALLGAKVHHGVCTPRQSAVDNMIVPVRTTGNAAATPTLVLRRSGEDETCSAVARWRRAYVSSASRNMPKP